MAHMLVQGVGLGFRVQTTAEPQKREQPHIPRNSKPKIKYPCYPKNVQLSSGRPVQAIKPWVTGAYRYLKNP